MSPSRDLQSGDDVIRDVLQVLHDGANGVPVRSDEHRLSCLQIGYDSSLPKRHHPLDDSLQALGGGDILLIERLVLGLLLGVVLAVWIDLWRREIEAATPDLHLPC